MRRTDCRRLFRRLQQKLYLVLRRVCAEPNLSRRLAIIGGRKLNRILNDLDDLSVRYEPVAPLVLDTFNVIVRYVNQLEVQLNYAADCQMRRRLVMLVISRCDRMHISLQARQELMALLAQTQESPIQEINTILANELTAARRDLHGRGNDPARPPPQSTTGEK